jgi:glutathione S-transferase
LLAKIRKFEEIRVSRKRELDTHPNQVLEDRIDETENIVPSRCTLVDAYAYSMVRWIDKLEGGFGPYPSMKRFMDRMKADLYFQKALLGESA